PAITVTLPAADPPGVPGVGARRPPDEDQRLARLRALKLLNSPPEPIFDACTRLAALVCDAPIAMVSVIDEHRQWFKSQVGLTGLQQTARDVAFCAHTILGDAVMEVPDALADTRFAGNPLVLGDPHIRFYAGTPLQPAPAHRAPRRSAQQPAG
ncbi:MAG: GAF domain-containing protein, partial [Rubrivivax sp.]|nr:GAF domain-containing protein [Rubrivivax sp.]